MKKYFCLVFVLLIVLLLVFVFFLSNNNSNSFTIGNYVLKTSVKEVDEKIVDKSYFITSFSIKKGEYNNKYYVVFTGLGSEQEDNNKGVIYDMIPPSHVTINRKDFDYYLNSDNEATLQYIITNYNDLLVIKIIGSDVYDKNGKVVETNALVDDSVINSKELSKVLKFTIKRK